MPAARSASEPVAPAAVHRARARASRPRPRRSLRRRLLIALLVLLALLGGAVLALPQVGRWYLVQKLLPRLARRFDRKLSVSRVRVGYHRAVLEGIEICSPRDVPGAPLASIPRVTVEYELGPLLRGQLRASSVLVEDLTVRLTRGPAGDNFSDLLDRRRLGEGEGKIKVQEVLVRGGQLTAEDTREKVWVTAGGLHGRLIPGGESRVTLRPVSISSPRMISTVSLGELEVTARMKGGKLEGLPRVRVGGGRLRLLPHLELSGIHGTIAPEAARIGIYLDGSYGGAEAKLWSASGWVDAPRRQGELKIRAARFSLGRVATILKRTPVILPARTMIDGDLDLRFASGVLRFKGQLEVKGLNLFHPGLARTPVLDLAGAAKVDGSYDLVASKLELPQLELRSHGLELKLTGSASRVGSGKPKVALRLEVPPVPCQTVLSSFPPSLLPQLQGFELKGTFGVDLRATVDYTSLESVQLGGRVGIDRCKVVKAPEEMSAARLKEQFEHSVEVAPGQTRSFVVGPENSDFAPFAEISKHMVNAVLTTEDAGFFRHRGFIPSQFRNALSRNLQRGGFRLGASTITMQMVKNVLLSQEKTLSRKLQELFLTWYLEHQLSKERMMEIYLNVIEFGPGVYGIGSAARHYFDKAAKELSPLEAAFFASLLPSPKRRYVQYCHGSLTPQWERYVRRLLRRMIEKGYVDGAAQKAAEGQSVAFSRDLDALSESDCNRQLKDLLDSWGEEERRRMRDSVLRSAPHQLDLYLKPASN